MTDGAAADAARPSATDLSRGTNQTGVRLYNERLVLSLIRKHGSLPKAEIARQTGLSPQTITVIMRQLERDGLVVKRDRRRGKVGQPSVPFALNPDGAYSVGLKIGRRSCDLVLLDLVGTVRDFIHGPFDYPTPAAIAAFVDRGIRQLVARLGDGDAGRIAGLGIAAPFELRSWLQQVGAPRDVLDHWRTFDIAREIGRICPWPVTLCNDATAACGAELVLGNPGQYLDFLYVFVGSFAGGGIVLNGSLYPGRDGNAGAIGSMPITTAGNDGMPMMQQLIRHASIYVLQNRLAEAGRDPSVLWLSPGDWGDLGEILNNWIDEAGDSLALAAVTATSVLDFEAIVIDGAFPTAIRARIVERVAARVERFDRQGLSPAKIVEGSVGTTARAVGGACLPLLAHFTRDSNLLFKETT
ncbi:MAG: ROK family transcriptional regulator [Bauldia sp.]|uniref:ROK family transcriptional regulator n=1 Tax=Bauldia sp. TaxID=2575872 RepID=UPI001D79DB0D|nr:ROK family transcriptional regulator [Bauldia sp.]MCB1497228.1 ROK family transcriptional regulator [Bauldia sp.]